MFVHAGAIESGMPFARRVIIQNAGHLVPYEQPDIFNDKVLNFLNGAEFNKILKTKGVAEAVEMFTAKRKEVDTWIPFSEAEMNILGYRHLQEGKLEEAIELFSLMLPLIPNRQIHMIVSVRLI